MARRATATTCVAREFKIFTNINSTIVDPKAFDPSSFDIEADVRIIPPNSFALARTVEFFRIPRSTLVVCLGKTYARCGIVVNVTPLEPEVGRACEPSSSNTTPLPAKIYANEGVAQMLFFESDEVCGTSYGDRGGKSTGQTGVTCRAPESVRFACMNRGRCDSAAPPRSQSDPFDNVPSSMLGAPARCGWRGRYGMWMKPPRTFGCCADSRCINARTTRCRHSCRR